MLRPDTAVPYSLSSQWIAGEGWWNIDNHIAGPLMSANVADETNSRGGHIAFDLCIDHLGFGDGRVMEECDVLSLQLLLKLIAQNRAEFATPLISTSVAADQHEDLVDFAGADEAALMFIFPLEDVLLFAG